MIISIFLSSGIIGFSIITCALYFLSRDIAYSGCRWLYRCYLGIYLSGIGFPWLLQYKVCVVIAITTGLVISSPSLIDEVIVRKKTVE